MVKDGGDETVYSQHRGRVHFRGKGDVNQSLDSARIRRELASGVKVELEEREAGYADRADVQINGHTMGDQRGAVGFAEGRVNGQGQEYDHVGQGAESTAGQDKWDPGVDLGSDLLGREKNGCRRGQVWTVDWKCVEGPTIVVHFSEKYWSLWAKRSDIAIQYHRINEQLCRKRRLGSKSNFPQFICSGYGLLSHPWEGLRRAFDRAPF